jgi:hypothetical protein
MGAMRRTQAPGVAEKKQHALSKKNYRLTVTLRSATLRAFLAAASARPDSPDNLEVPTMKTTDLALQAAAR